MSTVVSGSVTAFFLFDVAEAIDLERAQAAVGSGVATRLSPKPTTPSYVQYRQPPLAIEGRLLAMPEVEGFTVRLKAFDYGVVSVALTRALSGSWSEWLEYGLTYHERPALAQNAERFARQFVERIAGAMVRPRSDFLSEDYLAFAVTGVSDTQTADSMLATHGATIAQLLRAERGILSAEERDEVLRHHISYLADDVVIPTWSSAFIRDTDAGAMAALEILEFANSQLLEFRYYDRLLDAELEQIYPQLQRVRWFDTWLSRRYTRAARRVHSLYIDINELTDKAESALPIVGDIYTARLFGLAAARLGLTQWKASVRDKLTTLDGIYRFSVEHTAMARGEFLELIVVLILLLELVLLLGGVAR